VAPYVRGARASPRCRRALGGTPRAAGEPRRPPRAPVALRPL